MMLTIRQVRPWGAEPVDVALADGRIAAIGVDLPRGGDDIDGRGGVLLPGLHDHHLHCLALAARRRSVDLSGLVRADDVRAALARARPVDGWVRAVGYDERAAGLPDAALLDHWVGPVPLRLQDRTGALWVLNSAGLAQLGADLPPGTERDASGQPTGRFWREDQWLASALPRSLPDLGALGQDLAALGLTALTDATAHNGPAEARLLAQAMPQRLTLMGSEALPCGEGYHRGALKLLIDERASPDPDALALRVAGARAQGRGVAAHCVTEAELVVFLAALAVAGARPGDRIEHGGMIGSQALGVIAAAGLTVVTNPAFLHDRGDRYAATMYAGDLDDLYRLRSLVAGGIPMLAGSDAPYASVDPWLGMRAARDRRSAGGLVLAAHERIDALSALRLYAQGTLAVGAPADLVLCAGSMAEVLSDLTAERVRATFIGGKPVAMPLRDI